VHETGDDALVDTLFAQALKSGSLPQYRKQRAVLGFEKVGMVGQMATVIDMHDFTVGMALAAVRLELVKPRTYNELIVSSRLHWY
jgi:hypothetical protein